MVIWKHLFQRILQHQNRKRKYSWEAADRLPCPYIPPQTSALVTPSGIPDQLSFGLTQLGCFHILKSILFILLFLNCSAVLLRAIVKHSYVPLQAWTWSQKGFCLFGVAKYIQESISLYIHTQLWRKTNQAKKKLFKTEETHDTVQRQSTWLLHLYLDNVFCNQSILWKYQHSARFSVGAHVNISPVTAFKSNQD